MDSLAYDNYINPRRVEMIGGKISAMSPQPWAKHNDTAGNIRRAFHSRLKGRGCTSPDADYAVYFDECNYVVPDVMIVCDRSKYTVRGIQGAPDLIVEVVSPGSRTYDRGVKKSLYSRYGVKEYWLVDPIHRIVEVYLNAENSLEISETYELYPDYITDEMTDNEIALLKTEVPVSFLPDIKLPLEEIFANPFA